MTLEFLQQNAEWMCAIAIVGFTAVQCWLAHQQNIQNIRLKRLELANELDSVAAKFLGDKEQAEFVRTWLVSNTSRFAFLLDKKDIIAYKNLLVFIHNYNIKPAILPEDVINAISEFLKIVSEIDFLLGSAKYGITNNCKEFAVVQKNK